MNSNALNFIQQFNFNNTVILSIRGFNFVIV